MKTGCCIIFLFISIAGIAQTETQPSKSKRFNYGFTLATHFPNIIENCKLSDDLSIHTKAGYGLGIFLEQRLTTSLFLAQKLELSMFDDLIQYNGVTQEILGVALDDVNLDLGLQVGYRKSWDKFGFYLFSGASARLPVNQRFQGEVRKIVPNYTFDFGLGIKRKFDSFSLSAEVRRSLGITDLIKEPTHVPCLSRNTSSLVLKFSRS